MQFFASLVPGITSGLSRGRGVYCFMWAIYSNYYNDFLSYKNSSESYFRKNYVANFKNIIIVVSTIISYNYIPIWYACLTKKHKNTLSICV